LIGRVAKNFASNVARRDIPLGGLCYVRCKATNSVAIFKSVSEAPPMIHGQA